MGTDFQNMVGLMEQNTDVFARVPAGLDHYQPLVRTMEGNVGNYDEVSSLPSFDLMAWFFVIPGIALVALAGIGLYSDRKRTKMAAGHVKATPA
jgi:hypothetical protein